MTMHNMMFSWSKVIVKCGDQYEMDLRNNLLFYLNEWESNRFIMNISETFNRCDMRCFVEFFLFSARLTYWIEWLLLIDVPIKDQLKSPLKPAPLTKWEKMVFLIKSEFQELNVDVLNTTNYMGKVNGINLKTWHYRIMLIWTIKVT